MQFRYQVYQSQTKPKLWGVKSLQPEVFFWDVGTSATPAVAAAVHTALEAQSFLYVNTIPVGLLYALISGMSNFGDNVAKS